MPGSHATPTSLHPHPPEPSADPVAEGSKLSYPQGMSEEQPYSPPALMEEGEVPTGAVAGDVALNSGDFGSGHVTGTENFGGGAQYHNSEAQPADSRKDHAHPVQATPTHQSPPPVQGGGPFNQHSNQNSIKSNDVIEPATETDQSHAPPSSSSQHSKINNQEKGGIPHVAIAGATKEPTALSTFKRHMCETYSSDDDDVFLPNPPSKSQADKCILSMEGEEGGGASRKIPDIAVVSPVREQEPDEEGEGEEEEGEEREKEEGMLEGGSGDEEQNGKLVNPADLERDGDTGKQIWLN